VDAVSALVVVGFLFLVYAAGVWVGRRGGARCLVWTLAGASFGGAVFAAPPEALAISLADAKTLAPKVAYGTRYLDLTHLPPEDRATWYGVLSFHLNSLSRERAIVRPRSLADGKVLAFNLADYRIDPFVYFRLEDVDTYFHVRVDVNGKRQNAAAPWLNAESVKAMTALTQSSTYLLRGDWFFAQTAIQEGRVAGYYDMLGLGKKQADFDALVGADIKKAEQLRLDIYAIVARSGVALNNRTVQRVPSLTGGDWSTFEYRTSVDRQNTLRLFQDDLKPPKGDGSERIAPLPNGLPATWLQDGNGNRVNTVPDFLASDGKAPGNDRRVHVGTVSCNRCHTVGLHSIDDYARKLYRGTLQLQSPDYDKLVRLRGQYLTDLDRELARDRLAFEQAVKECNGMTMAATSKAVAAAWEWYVERPVPASEAAAELGCTEADFMAKMKAYAAKDGLIDPVMAGYLATPPLPVRREHFEEIYPLLIRATGGVP
jgi:hypothetical protein